MSTCWIELCARSCGHPIRWWQLGGWQCRAARFDEPVVTVDDHCHEARCLRLTVSSRAAHPGGVRSAPRSSISFAHTVTLRHFPRSFGLLDSRWLVGHPLRLDTSPRSIPHIDDLTESLRIVPRWGSAKVRRLPGRCRTIPDQLFFGSGGLGIITEAWMRLQHRPRWQVTVSVVFDDWAAAVAATDDHQAGLARSQLPAVGSRPRRC